MLCSLILEISDLPQCLPITLLLCKPFIDSLYIWEIQLLYLMGTEKLIGNSVCMDWA